MLFAFCFLRVRGAFCFLLFAFVFCFFLVSHVQASSYNSVEIVFWQSIQDSDDADMFRAYLNQYPNGAFSSIARLKIQQLNGSSSKPSESAGNSNAESLKKTTKESSNETTNKSAPSRATRWCGLSSHVLEISDDQCLEKSGIPLNTEADAEWVSINYFGKYEKHKAFAISENSYGISAWRSTGIDAKKRALLDCNLRSSDARTCRVVNVNNEYESYQDLAASSDAALSSSGLLGDIAGRYHVEMNYQGIDGTLRVKVQDTNVSVTMHTCMQNLCANYQLVDKISILRGRYFGGTFKLETVRNNMPDSMNLRASISSDTTRIIGFWGFYEFQGQRVSD